MTRILSLSMIVFTRWAMVIMVHFLKHCRIVVWIASSVSKSYDRVSEAHENNKNDIAHRYSQPMTWLHQVREFCTALAVPVPNREAASGPD